MMYIFSEQFVLSLSHDEVVHGKGSLLAKMAGDDWQKFANLRALYAWMWAHPGKKLLFMGSEFAQRAEWNHDRSLDWHLLHAPAHAGVQKLIRDLNARYKAEPALFELDGDAAGFQWLKADAADENMLAFLRWSKDRKRHLACVANLSPVVRHGYRVGLPRAGEYAEIVNTDAGEYGGSNVGNHGRVYAEETAWDGQPASATMTLPPLSVLWLEPK
jgi:1,4-alpha-glucan branching enzyme